MLYEFALNDAASWVRGESRAGNLIKGEYHYSKWEMASAENVVSKQKWLNCTLQLCLWRMQERHFSFPSSFVFLFSAGLQQNSNSHWSNNPAEKTHAHKGYWSCCKPVFGEWNINSRWSEILEDFYLFFFDECWQLTKLPTQPERVCAQCLHHPLWRAELVCSLVIYSFLIHLLSVM